MPLVLIAVGVLLIITGEKGNPTQLWQLIVNDFEGQNGNKGYLAWMFAIVILGALGYIPRLQTLSRAFMTLVLIVLLVHNQGFFAKVFAAIQPYTSGSSSSGTSSSTTSSSTG